PILVGLLQRLAARVDVIEDAELHVAFPPTLSRNFWPEPTPAKAKPSIGAVPRLSPSRGSRPSGRAICLENRRKASLAGGIVSDTNPADPLPCRPRASRVEDARKRAYAGDP